MNQPNAAYVTPGNAALLAAGWAFVVAEAISIVLRSWDFLPCAALAISCFTVRIFLGHFEIRKRKRQSEHIEV